jgi:hypothetical protein
MSGKTKNIKSFSCWDRRIKVSDLNIPHSCRCREIIIADFDIVDPSI